MYHIEINGLSANELGYDDFDATDEDSAADYMRFIRDDIEATGIPAALQLIDEDGNVIDETVTDWE